MYLKAPRASPAVAVPHAVKEERGHREDRLRNASRRPEQAPDNGEAMIWEARLTCAVAGWEPLLCCLFRHQLQTHVRFQPVLTPPPSLTSTPPYPPAPAPPSYQIHATFKSLLSSHCPISLLSSLLQHCLSLALYTRKASSESKPSPATNTLQVVTKVSSCPLVPPQLSCVTPHARPPPPPRSLTVPTLVKLVLLTYSNAGSCVSASRGLCLQILPVRHVAHQNG